MQAIIVERFQLAEQPIAIVTDDDRMRQILAAHLFTDFTPLPGKEIVAGDLVVELLTRSSVQSPLIQQPILPLNTTPIRLRRERNVEGWVLGDLLHVEDGLHMLELNYSTGRARGFFEVESLAQQPKLLTHTYALLAIVELLRTQAIYFLHAACAVPPRGGAVLLIGDGGRGKSTTLYLLLRQGWSYVGDDTLLLYLGEDGRVKVAPLLRRFMLHGHLTHRFPGLMLERLEADGKGAVAAHAQGMKARRPRATPDHAILLQRADGAHSLVAPVRKSNLLAELIRQNQFIFFQSELASRHLELLTLLCKQCDTNRLELAEDVLDEPRKLVGLLDRYERSHEQECFF